MKNNFVVVVALCIMLCGCATNKYSPSKSIWYNLSPAEKDGEKGMVVTSLYFTSDSTVDIYSSVKIDTAIAVKPFKWAKGTYTVFGNPKRKANLSITAISLREEHVKYDGIFQKDDTMILVSDSIVNAFNKVPKIKLP